MNAEMDHETAATLGLLSLGQETPVTTNNHLSMEEVDRVRSAMVRNIYSLLVEFLQFRMPCSLEEYGVMACKMEQAFYIEADTLDDYCDVDSLKERVLFFILTLLFKK